MLELLMAVPNTSPMQGALPSGEHRVNCPANHCFTNQSLQRGSVCFSRLMHPLPSVSGDLFKRLIFDFAFWHLF